MAELMVGPKIRLFVFAVTLVVANLVQAQTIVSTAPSLTETVFLLGGESELIGITSFCNYPPKTANIPKIGGFYDMNEEQLLRLRPDIILGLNTNEKLQRFCHQHNLPAVFFPHQTTEDVYSMIKGIGQILGKSEQANEEVSRLRQQYQRLSNQITTSERPRALVIVSQVLRSGELQAAYIVGSDEFYQPLMADAGMENAYHGSFHYPYLSVEGIIELDPSVIIVFEKGELESFQRLPVEAVKKQQIYFLKDDVYKRPGPRFIEILKAFSKLAKAISLKNS